MPTAARLLTGSLSALLMLACLRPTSVAAQDDGVAVQDQPVEIPLPEHPRPIFMRPDWQNLNGYWDFRFDPGNAGTREGWQRAAAFQDSILVPFPWGAPLSGQHDEADIGWYARTLDIPADWNQKRIFLVVGAADWTTDAWIDGQSLGTHRGGYTPFEFELTPHVRPGTSHQLVLRVDDTPHDFKLEGKQGYGPARGIWQTPYLEARGRAPLDLVHFTPDLSSEAVQVEARLLEPASEDLELALHLSSPDGPDRVVRETIPAGQQAISTVVPMPDAHLWSLEDPYLYDVEAVVSGSNGPADRVHTYFGMREISVVDLPGTDIPYVALNGEPVYLQLALDQAYHLDGFYTFPTDEFIRDEVLRSRQIGLNGLRVHVKIAHPRKLYWADRLGLLIMADVPNSWGEPTEEMQQEVTYALRQMIKRDYNHPSIFSWVPFNETWGLYTGEGEGRAYLPETQRWVASVYRLTKELDPTRLVEDNSVCCGRGHTETDLNSWHAYLPGWAWDAELDSVSAGAYPGSTWNYEAGYKQARQPLINSEFGNVWGYQGSTGDVDWSWDYHRALDAFRRHPKVAGWLYTEHHDVINEWNGYWRFDRSEKYTGLEELVEGMTLADLHAPFYLSVGEALSQEVAAGATVEVPLWASFLTGTRAHGDTFLLKARLYGWDALGRKQTYATQQRTLAYRPWMSEALPPLQVTMPDGPAVAVLAVSLETPLGTVLHRNFTTFAVQGDVPERTPLTDGSTLHAFPFEAAGYSAARWSQKHWQVLDGLKVNGAGSGYFEYRLPWPSGLADREIEQAALLFEASAKQLFGKDRDDATAMGGDYMRGRGTHDPSRNPNAYPMTDEERFPSAVSLSVGGQFAGRYELPDDPADHRGILSWQAQLRDRRLREAGSYGWLIEAPLPLDALQEARRTGTLVLRFEVDDALPGGLALYSDQFGRYPVSPTLLFRTRPASGTR